VNAVANDGQGRTPVVLIHGIWMTGLEMRWLGGRLADCGFDPHYFHYPSLRVSPRYNARALAAYVRRLGAQRVHLVAHSLGGILVLHLCDQFRDLPPGRVVLLGSPVRGSGVARVLAESRMLHPLLGASHDEGLDGRVPPWRGARELGTVAGTRGIGVGRVIGGLHGASDGTVAVAETRLEGAVDAIELPVSHMEMLFSGAVAEAVCRFLSSGRFRSGSG